MFQPCQPNEASIKESCQRWFKLIQKVYTATSDPEGASQCKSLMLAMCIVLFLPMQSSLTSFWRSFTGLVEVIFSYLILLLPYVSLLNFSRKLHSAFRLDWKTRSQRSHVFHLTGTAALHCGHTFVGDWRYTYCQWPIIELGKNVSPKNKMAASHVAQIHMHARFPRSKKWPTYHVVVPTGML